MLSIKNGEHLKTSGLLLLSCPLLRSLWPSLLLYFLHNLPHIPITAESETWQKNMKICESLEFLLNKSCFTQYEDKYSEPILTNLNACLGSRLNIVKRILEHRKKYLPTAVDQNISVKRILNGLQDHCILAVLKKSIDIHECDLNEVENILYNKKDAKKTFRSYRAMQTALKAILASEINNARAKDTAANYYTELESLLNSINPLPLRLEVIENVFSMLFLRHDVHFSAAEGTSEEEDYETAFSEKERHSSAHESRESETHKRYGFICNKYTVKRLLRHLKRCTVQVGIDFAKLRRELGNTKDLEAIQKSILAMDNALADAFWRLELLTSHDFVESKDDNENFAVSSSDSDTVIDEKLSFSVRLKSKSIFYNQRTESSSEESEQDLHKSDVDVSSETGSIDANNTSNHRRRKRTRNHISITAVDGGFALKSSNSKFIVNLMLASKESLVLQCLWKGDYTRAQQVIEVRLPGSFVSTRSEVSYSAFELLVRVFFEYCRLVFHWLSCRFAWIYQSSRGVQGEVFFFRSNYVYREAEFAAATATTPA